jgi:hypothetical protein
MRAKSTDAIRGPRAGNAVVMSLILLAACVSLLAVGCTPDAGVPPTVDVATEEAAVAAVLNEESTLAIAGDLDGLLALYVQDEKNARLSVTTTVSAMISGWDAVRGHQENLLESSWMDWEDKQFSKENLFVKVHGDDAWTVCDNVWTWSVDGQRKQFQNIQLTILEKHEGRWLISFQAFIRDPEHMEIVDLPS